MPALGRPAALEPAAPPQSRHAKGTIGDVADDVRDAVNSLM